MTTLRKPEAGLSPRDCPSCGERYQPYRSTQRACSRNCVIALGPIPESDRTFSIEFNCKMCGTAGVAFTSIPGGRRHFCDDCQPEATRLRAERKNVARRLETTADPAKRRAETRRQNLKKSYDLTVEQYDEMFSAQSGLCAICGNEADPNGVRAASRLHVGPRSRHGQGPRPALQ